MSRLTAKWRGLPAGARAGIAVIGVLVLINVGLSLLDSATRGADRSGSRSSSFSTASTGTEGYATLLERFGHPTSRARGNLADLDLDPGATLIVLDAGRPSSSERQAVDEFVANGGELVAGGPDALAWTLDGSSAWAGGFTNADIHWEPRGPQVTRTTVDGTAYRVRTDGDGRWVTPDGGSLTEEKVLSPTGSIRVVADPSPLQNRRLDEADNAAFGIALAGAERRPVVFAEGPHGFGGATGLDAIPSRWKVALVGGALAALLTLIAASRRLGPAEARARRLPPPRRAYVDAVGSALGRARRPGDAIAPLQAAAREHLARRSGLPVDAAPELIRAAAAQEGWSAKEIDALFAPATDNESILAAGRALARAERGAS